MPDVKSRFQEQGVEPVGGTATKFDDQIRAEIKKWAAVVHDAGIQPE